MSTRIIDRTEISTQPMRVWNSHGDGSEGNQATFKSIESHDYLIKNAIL